VHPVHHVRPGVVEDLVAPLEPGEVVQAQRGGLQRGAHCTVGDQHPVFESAQERRVRDGRHAARIVVTDVGFVVKGADGPG